ncbi:MAG TPA: VOC family protein [Mycobacterium sp.]|nr:VOC family protein [Mycobacterium sp.]
MGRADRRLDRVEPRRRAGAAAGHPEGARSDPGQGRLHVDFTVPDLDAEVDQLIVAGASLVGRRGDENFHWVTLADPQGNQFCVAPRTEAAESYDTA